MVKEESAARRMGGAKRYHQLLFYRGDGFRGAQPILRAGKNALKTATKNTATLPNGWD
jgi:hypothetical protein